MGLSSTSGIHLVKVHLAQSYTLYHLCTQKPNMLCTLASYPMLKEDYIPNYTYSILMAKKMYEPLNCCHSQYHLIKLLHLCLSCIPNLSCMCGHRLHIL